MEKAEGTYRDNHRENQQTLPPAAVFWFQHAAESHQKCIRPHYERDEIEYATLVSHFTVLIVYRRSIGRNDVIASRPGSGLCIVDSVAFCREVSAVGDAVQPNITMPIIESTTIRTAFTSTFKVRRRTFDVRIFLPFNVRRTTEHPVAAEAATPVADITAARLDRHPPRCGRFLPGPWLGEYARAPSATDRPAG